MSDPEDLPAVIAAAEHAAATGDFAAAESLLRVALHEQEAHLGVAHPAVATTLNNLAVLCERTNQMAEAERCYRRASELTLSALGPFAPLTLTSRDNLRAFLLARAVPAEWLNDQPTDTPAVQTGDVAPVPSAVPATLPTESVIAQPPPAPVVMSTPAPSAAAARVARQSTAPAAPRAQTAKPPAGGSRGVLALAALVLVAAGLLWWATAGGETTAELSTPSPSALPAASVTPGVAPVAASPTPSAPSADPGSAPPAPPPVAPSPIPLPVARNGVSVAGDIRVVEARICATLTTGGGPWRCTAPANPAAPGRVSFYTRVASARAVRVHHVWFRNDTLQRDVALSIGANPSAGFRTFSRHVIDAAPGTEWRVELRTSDGRLLQEERIIVR